MWFFTLGTNEHCFLISISLLWILNKKSKINLKLAPEYIVRFCCSPHKLRFFFPAAQLHLESRPLHKTPFYWKFLWDPVDICTWANTKQEWMGEVFPRGEAVRVMAKIFAGQGRGLNLRGGAPTAFLSWLKLYTRAEETLIFIALSEFSQINSTIIIIIVIAWLSLNFTFRQAE